MFIIMFFFLWLPHRFNIELKIQSLRLVLQKRLVKRKTTGAKWEIQIQSQKTKKKKKLLRSTTLVRKIRRKKVSVYLNLKIDRPRSRSPKPEKINDLLDTDEQHSASLINYHQIFCYDPLPMPAQPSLLFITRIKRWFNSEKF